MSSRINIPYTRLLPLLSMFLGLGILAYILTSYAAPVRAAPAFQEVKPSNEFCLVCHQHQGASLRFENEWLDTTINPTEFGLSVHSEEGINCVDCHSDITDYPHPPVSQKDSRDFSLALLTICKDCHEEQAEKVQDSVHQNAFNDGNKDAAVCTDCHNPHTQKRLTDKTSGELTNAARLGIPQICSQCHDKIYETYKLSVHGNALTQEGNTDVPTCIDCHGVHNISNPTTSTFRNSIPFLCSKCHTNNEIMDKYGISTKVLETYVADFHGTNVKLFTEEYPDQPTNKPVCIDCHGFHDISKVDNPETGIALRENLLVKCQRCHPDATTNYPEAWMSHYEASPEHFPIVYYVNLFYKFFIPTVIGGMIFFILTDIYRRIINRAKGARHS